jgi:hypothetical protein
MNEYGVAGSCKRRAVVVEGAVQLCCACVDSSGLTQEPRRSFKMSRACGRSQSYRWSGKSLLVLHRPAMK